MKILTKSETVGFSNSDTCSGFEFQFEDRELNVAVVTVYGRYPDEGHLVNEVCREIAYVFSGTGSVGVEDEKYTLNPGDAVHIEPGERFYWQGDELKMLMACSPAFYPEQHKEVK
jgi:mannose-6-phosphate isomerase-like protein (cupin superfamily)